MRETSNIQHRTSNIERGAWALRWLVQVFGRWVGGMVPSPSSRPSPWGRRGLRRAAAGNFNAIGFVTVFFLFAYLFLPVSGFGAEAASRFDGANKLYEQGKYGEAIAAYRGMIEAGEASAAVYFNLGNAYYKAERVGEAVASYRLAERLAPRDPEVQANLRFVLETAGIRSGVPIPWWQAWTQRLSLREWAWLTGLAVWALAVFGVLRTVKPVWQNALKLPATIAGFLVLLAGGGAAMAWQGAYGEPRAVVKVKEAVVRYGPLDDSQSHFSLRDGAEVVVTDKKDGWWQVRDGQGRTGWVKAEAVVKLEEF